ncbi:MAG: hypothetical protein Q8Q88_06840 [Phenylobacterium sp.]|uniref:hypothetical protein n=1 Tax=Phenylobacterium sp. TaxID=1871053 RepID=UPI002734F558|nr:hypothetical protein [Phenylobacterium sp.]MDP3746752.1 hypothetical protein [Phenylobacterium sp.]
MIASEESLRRRPPEGGRDPLLLVVPVWGSAYLRPFVDFALPSLLADENIPAVAATRPVSFSIVTRTQDIPALRASRALDELSALADVDFISIDDLLSSAATYVTLTLAYHRALARSIGPDGGSAVLLNSDFILSRNALGGLVRALDAGATAVLSPSLRVIESEAVKLLEARKQSPTVLSVSARDLVSIALRTLHPTVLCARMDQGEIHSAGAHLYVWRPEPQTLVGRGFCLFPLALKIKPPVRSAESFCDYGLIPLQVPDAKPVILNDSDEFFALELAALEHELDLFQIGRADPKRAAKAIGRWSVKFHHDQAHTPLFFRAADPGPCVASAVEASETFVNELLANVPEPLPLKDHVGWLAAVAMWRADRAERGVVADPPELAGAPTEPPRQPPGPVRRLARTLLAGRPGRLRFWHPRWRVARVLSGLERRDHDLDLHAQVIGRSVFGELCAFDSDRDTAVARPSSLFVGLLASRTEERAQALAMAAPALERAAAATVFLLAEGSNAVERHSLAAMFSWLEAHMEVRRLRVYDLRIDEWVRRTHGRLADQFAGATVWRKFLLVGASAVAVGLMTAVGCGRLLGIQQRSPKHVSVAILEARRRGSP